MILASIQHFIAMGGYAFYIWVSYGLALCILLGNTLTVSLWHKHILRNLRSNSDVT